jgi:hypothetical protein
MQTDRIDVILATLNAAEVGSLDAIGEKMRQELTALNVRELAQSAASAREALSRGDVVEFRRLRAFLQSRVGHLR